MEAAQAPQRKNPHSKNSFGGAGAAATAIPVYAAARFPDPRGSVGHGGSFDV